MKLALMQPYFFPYLGYFQLIHSVDRFVFYDDVNFIKGGWINRNRILVNKQAYLFSLPLKEASPYKQINEILLDEAKMDRWSEKFMMTLEQSYKKAPGLDQTMQIVESVLSQSYSSVGDIAKQSILSVAKALDLKTEMVPSSIEYQNEQLSGTARVLDICLQNRCSEYINVMAGRDLYEKGQFAAKNIQLHFLSPKLTPYQQNSPDHVPALSIVDVLMFNPLGKVVEMLDKYELV